MSGVVLLVIIGAVIIAMRINDRVQPIKDLSFTEGIGINIHEVTRNEIDMLADLGVTWVRIDLTWEVIESEPGVYEYEKTNYDELVDAITDNGLRPYFILNYGNPLYSEEQSVMTEEGQAHFARYVKETVERYQGMNGVWEIWNEPNYDTHWLTEPTYIPYAALVEETAPIIKKEDPTATVAGPALLNLNGESLMWMEEIFKLGVLEHLDALSVHPYRHTSPETIAGDYQLLQELIANYTDREDLLIFSGEWGYSLTSLPEEPAQSQADYLVRMMLMNEYQSIPISIWYGFRDNGTDMTNELHHFGLLDASEKQKPAYIAMQTLLNTFKKFEFQERLDLGEGHYILRFVDEDGESLYACWTISEEPEQVTLTLPEGTGELIDVYGQVRELEWSDGSLQLELTGSPVYLQIK